jgi:lipid II:glycine glycyltransferase (peptidoglycan interpeptide bridge formation enzyme)
MHLKSDIQPKEWNNALRELSGAHILQTWEWGQAKSMYGWKPFYKLWVDENDRNVAAALVLEKSLSTSFRFPRLRVLYVPKGPILDWENEIIRRKILGELIRFGKKRDAVFIKIDPDVDLGFGVPGKPENQIDNSTDTTVVVLKELGWIYSNEQIQFKNSVVLNLHPDLDDLLGNMKQKTRYNIRLSGRKGVDIREGTEKDFSLLFEMYSETAVRDGFVIRDFNYYKDLWTIFYQRNMAVPLIAEFEGVPLAAIFLFYFDRKAWFLFGMSRNSHREKMPNYLLQWAAISKAKALGCDEYDFWGAPDEFEPGDPMWGVYKFKSGFGGKVVRRIGAWDYVIHSTYYMLYSRFIPLILNLMRKKSVARINRAIN